MNYNVYIINDEFRAIRKIGENLTECRAYIRMRNTDKKLLGTLNFAQMVEVGSEKDKEYSI